jgi:acetoin utilization protein AcuC
VSQGRWIATGGGGYQWATVVPRAWTTYFAEMSGVLLPDEIPGAWLERVELDTGAEVPPTFSEPPLDLDRLDASTESTIERVRRACFPSFGLEP